MVNISVFLEPKDPDSRKAWRLRELPFGLFPYLNDEAATALFRDLLALRRQALSGVVDEMDEAYDKAMAVARALVEGVAGWSFYNSIADAVWATDAYEGLPPRVRRRAVSRVIRSVPLITEAQRVEITHALESLDFGQTDEILEPEEKKRRRRKPRDAADAELDMLTWIRWQVGLGRRAQEVFEVVSDAVHISVDAIHKWRKAAEKSFGKDFVRLLLQDAEAIGRMEKDGAQPTERSFNTMILKKMHAMSLPRVVEKWRRAQSRN